MFSRRFPKARLAGRIECKYTHRRCVTAWPLARELFVCADKWPGRRPRGLSAALGALLESFGAEPGSPQHPLPLDGGYGQGWEMPAAFWKWKCGGIVKQAPGWPRRACSEVLSSVVAAPGSKLCSAGTDFSEKRGEKAF